MKLRKIPVLVVGGLAAAGLALLEGCGGGSGANVITITVTASGSTSVFVGTSLNLTATVNGATTATATWQPCMYTTTPTTGTNPQPSPQTKCPDDGSLGTLSNSQTATAPATITYMAPNAIPDQTKFPNLKIIITATSTQDTKKTGSITLTLNSGISVSLTPTTATVPTKEMQQFSVSLTNDLETKGVTWLITQQVPTATTPVPKLATCSPTCGTITPLMNNPNVARYTAPDTVPTTITPADTTNKNPPANLAVVAFSNADNSCPQCVAAGTITIIQGGPITFKGITPTIAPQGAAFWDIFLDAPNISSSSQITLTDSNNGTLPIDSSLGQIKILFPLPTSTTANPNSTGARIRLLALDLKNAGPITVTVTDPAETVTQCSGTPLPQGCSVAGTFTFNIIPVRATTTAISPDDFVLGSQGPFPVTIDGGYFGPNGNSAVAFFQSPGVDLTAGTGSNARQIFTSVDPLNINPAEPGLYPLYVRSNASPAPSPGNPAVSNIALFPDYSSNKPQLLPIPIAAGTNPSAIDIDPELGVLAVAETGSNTVEFFSIGNGTVTSLGVVGSAVAAPINVPTGISIDRNNHTVAVVNYGSQTASTTNGVCKISALAGQSVTVLNIPGSPSPITPFSVDLTGALQGSVCPAPMPYSIGVDSDSHLALVAYSSNSISSVANVGLIVNLNPNSGSNPYGCTLGNAIAGQTSGPVGQCLYAQTTLNSGVYPHISVASHSHLALATPGGSGAVRGVDVTKQSSANVISSSVLTAGLVTVTVDTTKCVPGIPQPPSGTTSNPCPLLMIPGNAGTALITGVTAGNAANTSFFNGVFPVTVTSNNSFTYVVNSTVTDTGTVDPKKSFVYYGGTTLIFPFSSTLQGVAINPITNTAALADANSTGTNGSQIDLLNGLDQTISSITFFANCTAFNTSCPNSPELLATTDVAWQPFTNELVSYNPKLGQLSISDPVGRNRYAIVASLGPSAVAFPVSNGTTSNTLTLWGSVVVDPATNQAFILESGNGPNKPGQIEIVNLGGGGVKPLHVSELLVPSPTPGIGVIGGIPNASVPQATLTSKNPLSGVRIFGSGFSSGAQVRLDGVDITTQGGTIDSIAPSGREIDVTIPPFFLSAPHHFALDILENIGGSLVQSNVTDFYVIQSVDFSQVCGKDNNGNLINPQSTGVAIADQLANGPFSPIAIVTNTGCGSVSTIDLNPSSATFGAILNTIAVGKSPLGVAVSERFGLAVVSNNGDNTASIVNLLTNKQAVPAVSTGTKPMGVAINDSSAVTIVADNGANEVTEINLAPLFAAPPATTLTPTSIGGMQQPIAVAIDPDRGTNNRGIAVVTGLQLQNGASPTGALYVVDMGGITPTLSSTNSFFSAIPTGIVFDPTVATGGNPGVFYANSTGTNVIASFNPDTGGSTSVSVGINPTSLALNPQTGAILTSNSAGESVSLVDTLSRPLRTRKTLAIPGAAQFGVAIDQFTNLAVIVDQANNRVLLFPMPN